MNRIIKQSCNFFQHLLTLTPFGPIFPTGPGKPYMQHDKTYFCGYKQYQNFICVAVTETNKKKSYI